MSLVFETTFNCSALRILSPGHSGYDVLIIKSVGASLLARWFNISLCFCVFLAAGIDMRAAQYIAYNFLDNAALV